MADIDIHARRNIPLILVDNDSSFVYFISEFLNRVPGLFIVGRAKTGEEMLHLAKTMHPGAILIDLDAETRTGADIVAMLRKECPHTALIALTDLEGYFPAHVLEALGIDSIVPKSLLTKLLVPVIQSAVQMRFPQAVATA